MKKTYLSFLLVAILVLIFSCTNTKASREESAEGIRFQNEDEFRVLSFEPEGELPASVKNPQIYVQFSKPVVALKKLGEVMTSSDVFSIEPKLDGVYRWYGTSLLAFEASDLTIPQMEYKVEVNPALVSIDGETIKGETSFRFKTQALRMLSVIPGYSAQKEGVYVNNNDVPLDLAKDIALVFSYPVNPEVIKDYLEIYADDAKLKFSVLKAYENLLHVSIEDTVPEDKKITVLLLEGGRSEKHFIGTEKRQAVSFQSLRPFVQTRMYTEGQSYSKYTNPLEITYSHNLDTKQIDEIVKGIKTTPSMPLTKDNVEILGRTIRIFGLPVVYEQNYSFSMDAEVKDIYGRSIVEKIRALVSVPPARSFVDFKDYGFALLEAEFAPKIAFEFQNILEGSEYRVNDFLKKFDAEMIPKNKRVTHLVDLEPHLKKEVGEKWGWAIFSANMRYKYKNYDGEYKEREQTNTQEIQVTDIGASLRYAYNKAVVLVSSLSKAEPIANARVRFYSSPMERSFSLLRQRKTLNLVAEGITNSEGLAIINFAPGEYRKQFFGKRIFVEIETENPKDLVIFNPNILNMYRYDVSSVRNPEDAEKEFMKTFIFTDRALYKPGETLTFRGIDRTLQRGEYKPYVGNYEIKIQSGYWNPTVYATINGKTTATGGFWERFEIPPDLKPGSYDIVYRRTGLNDLGTKSSCSFEIAFFERLRFEAKASISPGTYFRGDRLDGIVKAEYLGGGSLANANCYVSWYSEPSGFYLNTKEYKDYRFGPLLGYEGRNFLNREEGLLMMDGSASFSQTSGSEKLRGMAYQYRFEARVRDPGNQEIASVASAVVHPASFYLGIKKTGSSFGFVKKGDAISYDYILVDPNGNLPETALWNSKANEGKIKVELEREEWKAVHQIAVTGQLNTRYVKEMVSESTSSIKIQKSGSFTIKPQNAGSYLLRVSTVDSKGREVVSELRFYATGASWASFYGNNSAQEIQLVADKSIYTVGDTAYIMLQSPLPQGQYLITVEREGIFSERLIRLDEASTVLEVPIEDEYLPIVYVSVSSYSKRTGSPAEDYDTPDVNKPKGYFGLVRLEVDTITRAFDIAISTDKESYRPGEKARISLKATKDGKPLSNAEITLMAVDRGVIDLINYHVPNPINFFYNRSNFTYNVKGGDSRSYLIDPVTYAVKNLAGGDADEEDDDKLSERKNFDPTALFEPYLLTNAAGEVSCEFVLPDSLTEYRITAIGIDKNNYALSEGKLPVNNPLSARHVLPQRLRVNDISEAGMVISNLDSVPHEVKLSLKTHEGIERSGEKAEKNGYLRGPGKASLKGEGTKKITVKPNETLSVFFEIEALKAGFVSLEFTLESAVLNERIINVLEIDKQYLYETVTTVGQVGSSKKDEKTKDTLTELIEIPGDAEDNMGKLYVQLDPTRLGLLRTAVQYVFDYPYGCLEQRSARILPLVYFAEYLKVFDLDSKVADPKKVVQEELAYWAKSQLFDGGFPYWPGGLNSTVDVSIRIGEIVAQAKRHGIVVPASLNVKRLASFLKKQKTEMQKRWSAASSVYYYSYINYVLSLMGETVEVKELEEITNSKSADIASLAFTGLTYFELDNKAKAKEVAAMLKKHMKMTTQGVEISRIKTAPWWSFLNSNIADYALCLKLFTSLDPDDRLVPNLVHELLDMQNASHGYWISTANTARALDAFDTYIKTNKLESLDFKASASLSGKELLSGSFKGLSSELIENDFYFAGDALKKLPRDTELPLTFTKDGVGKLFYTSSLTYALPINQQSPRDEGIGLFVDYIDVETGKIVQETKLKSGKVYKARIFVSTTMDRNFVALRVPIPSGAEVVNAAFVTTGSYAEYDEGREDESGYDGAYGNSAFSVGLSNRDIFDNEVQYFWNYFPKGRQTVEFMFRAVRKGMYETPSATAECMYESEIFGRTAGRLITIE